MRFCLRPPTLNNKPSIQASPYMVCQDSRFNLRPPTPKNVLSIRISPIRVFHNSFFTFRLALVRSHTTSTQASPSTTGTAGRCCRASSSSERSLSPTLHTALRWTLPRAGTGCRIHPPIAGDNAPFDPAHLLALGLPSVLFGANHYASRLPDVPGWICWDKATRDELNLKQAEVEFGWTNFLSRPKMLRHMWSGAFRDSERGTRYHPAQKPTALMAWVLGWCPPGLVLDPYMGLAQLSWRRNSSAARPSALRSRSGTVRSRHADSLRRSYLSLSRRSKSAALTLGERPALKWQFGLR